MLFVAHEEPGDCSPKYASSLQIMDVSTGNLHQVLPPTCGLSSASWSPDGSEIAYGVDDENARGTYVLDLASGTTRKLSASPTLFDHVQRWSSDGNVVVVERTECPDGGECLARHTSSCRSPSVAEMRNPFRTRWLSSRPTEGQ